MKPHQGILTGFKRLKDKSVNINFNLNEISSEDFMEIDQQIDTFGVVYFSQKGVVTDEEKHAIDQATIELGGKTQSERIRNVLYVLHNQMDTTEAFESFYKRKTEEIIQHFKDKLI
jgi:hypothetical protein